MAGDERRGRWSGVAGVVVGSALMSALWLGLAATGAGLWPRAVLSAVVVLLLALAAPRVDSWVRLRGRR